MRSYSQEILEIDEVDYNRRLYLSMGMPADTESTIPLNPRIFDPIGSRAQDRGSFNHMKYLDATT